MSKMPEFTMLMGLPFSGKSTHAECYQRVASTDSIIENMCAKDGISYNEGFEKRFKEANRIMRENIQLWVKDKYGFAWDQTNLGRKKRVNAINQLPKEYIKKIIYFDLPMDVLLDRKAKREKENPGKIISEQILLDMGTSIDSPDFSEGWDIIEIRRI